MLGRLQWRPAAVNFGPVEVGTTSAALQVTVENSGASAIPITSVNVPAPFVLTNNACGSSLAANSDCALSVTFAPAQAGAATGTLTIVEAGGTQTVQLSGTGASPPADALSPLSLRFSGTIDRRNFVVADGHVDQQRRRAADLNRGHQRVDRFRCQAVAGLSLREAQAARSAWFSCRQRQEPRQACSPFRIR